MKILVTGSSGLVGSQVVRDLQAKNIEVVTFDIADSQNILNINDLSHAIKGVSAVIHSAALLGEPGQSDIDIMNVNLQGTWNLLSAASSAKIKRVVFLSSVDALGVFKGERAPDYLPIDNHHQCYPKTPYAISKYLAEEMCRSWALSNEASVVSLRPPGVWTADTYHLIKKHREQNLEFEWTPYWEYGAFIDVRDLSKACIQGLSCSINNYVSLLVSSSDLSSSGFTGKELSNRLHPKVEWRDEDSLGDSTGNEFKSLLNIDDARSILNWEPEHTWKIFNQSS